MEELEKALLCRCQAGDTEAFGTLVEQFAGRAIGTASMLLGNHDDAMDASQAAFVRAWRSIRRFKGKATFYTWYSTILRNECLDRIRHRKRRKAEALAPEQPAPPAKSDPHLLAERNEQAERVWLAILELPMHHRDIIVMSHFQEMRYKDIAKLLNIPVGTVMSRLHNARKALRRVLGGNAP